MDMRHLNKAQWPMTYRVYETGPDGKQLESLAAQMIRLISE